MIWSLKYTDRSGLPAGTSVDYSTINTSTNDGYTRSKSSRENIDSYIVFEESKLSEDRKPFGQHVSSAGISADGRTIGDYPRSMMSQEDDSYIIFDELNLSVGRDRSDKGLDKLINQKGETTAKKKKVGKF